MKTLDGTTRHGSQPPSVTGRDSYIVAQALYWFVREQQKLPEEQFEWSNVEDAKLILLTLWPSFGQCFAKLDECAGRAPANLKLEKYSEAADNVVSLRR
jgi:hypothetical protein